MAEKIVIRSNVVLPLVHIRGAHVELVFNAPSWGDPDHREIELDDKNVTYIG